MAAGIDSERFWPLIDELIAASQVVIDRPRGSPHPRYPGKVFPLDYGYLAQTHGGDGSGIDVWVGSLPKPSVTGAIVTIDLLKCDAEVKLLIGCSRDEAKHILAHHNQGEQAGVLLWRGPAPAQACRMEKVWTRGDQIVLPLGPSNWSAWTGGRFWPVPSEGEAP